jgi:hypothetical protein
MATPRVDVDRLSLPFLLLRLIPLLHLELTSCSVLCLAELGHRHRHRNSKVAVDEPDHSHHLEPFCLQGPDAEEIQRARRRPRAAQPPLLTLGEPCHRVAVARVRVYPQPRHEGDDGPRLSICRLIERMMTSGTDSVPTCR